MTFESIAQRKRTQYPLAHSSSFCFCDIEQTPTADFPFDTDPDDH